ncbi:hypothetical protein [Rhodococcus sp. ACS1]|uniref:hypothetical protein n=1 Tax=Rhodococcus sp. ACS1 TaxID=2028570 RepID=UPI0015CB4799|nr:hypothetical protein [Rhodococcus sp. ACS1]
MKVGDKVKVHTDATSESVIVSIDGEKAVIDGLPVGNVLRECRRSEARFVSDQRRCM